MMWNSSVPHTTSRARARLAGLATACILALGASLPAQASVITFSGVSGLIAHGDAFAEAGYVIGGYSNALEPSPGDLVGLISDGTDCINFSCPASTAASLPYYLALNDGYLYLSSETEGQTFRVSAFDASFAGAASTLAVPGVLRFQGVRADNTSVSADALLSGASGGNYGFNSFILPTAFSSQDFVELAIFAFACNGTGSCAAFSTDRAQFGIDNLVLTDTPGTGNTEVPEPSDMLLVILGLFSMGMVLRNRRGA